MTSCVSPGRGRPAACIENHETSLTDHPGTIAASKDMTRTDELAVMVDTFRPLFLTREAMELDDPAYPMSWLD